MANDAPNLFKLQILALCVKIVSIFYFCFLLYMIILQKVCVEMELKDKVLGPKWFEIYA